MKDLPIVDGIFQGNEGPRLEFKSALKGISNSTWETYSSFANTFGGVIIQGINDKTHEVEGVPNVELRIQEIWNTLNNPQIISRNILYEDNVWIHEVDGKNLIIMDVLRADNGLRPIYYKSLETGTFKRNGEGDYRCSLSEIAMMIRDQSDTTYDFTSLEGTTFDDIDIETFLSFRNMMKVSKPNHHWNDVEDVEFAKMIGALARDGNLTVAGLLMFGKEHVIYSYFPRYMLDYQEIPDQWPKWDYRLVTGDGTWEGNLFNFFRKITSKVSFDLPCPFEIGSDMRRISDTDAHKAVRECLINAIVNADYLGSLVIRVQKFQDHICIANSGLFRIPLEVAEKGGASNIRNRLIAKMFSMIDMIERAGTGVNFIFHTWAKSFGNSPVVTEDTMTQVVTFDLFTKVVAKNNHDVDDSIMEIMRANPSTSMGKIGDMLSLSASTVAKHIRTLRSDGKIERVGGTRGYWKVK